jgi:hypothetical protein
MSKECYNKLRHEIFTLKQAILVLTDRIIAERSRIDTIGGLVNEVERQEKLDEDKYVAADRARATAPAAAGPCKFATGFCYQARNGAIYEIKHIGDDKMTGRRAGGTSGLVDMYWNREGVFQAYSSCGVSPDRILDLSWDNVHFARN